MPTAPWLADAGYVTADDTLYTADGGIGGPMLTGTVSVIRIVLRPPRIMINIRPNQAYPIF
jgi:hypothetical protein